MKTAMQELLEYLQKDYDGLDKQKTEVSKIMKIAVATIIKNIEDLYISKEKEQIINAYSEGMAEGIIFETYDNVKPETPEQYYQQTFKKEQ